MAAGVCREGGCFMPLILGVLAFFCPRVIIVALVVFSDYIGRGFANDFWAFVGFFFAPCTTLAWAYAQNEGGLEGFRLAVFALAVLVDLGLFSDAANKARKGKLKAS